jgi:hypothetical protein
MRKEDMLLYFGVENSAVDFVICFLNIEMFESKVTTV